MKFSNISEYYFNSDNVTGYLSDFSKYNHEIDSIKLHEETITKNEISSDVEINNFEHTPKKVLHCFFGLCGFHMEQTWRLSRPFQPS